MVTVTFDAEAGTIMEEARKITKVNIAMLRKDSHCPSQLHV
jgi:hypothetical protein